VARGPLRHLADDVGARLARFILDVFFREVEVIGKERAPRGVPLLVIANHVNNLIDPMVIMGFAGVRPRFLAKSTLWRHPVVAPLDREFCIPRLRSCPRTRNTTKGLCGRPGGASHDLPRGDAFRQISDFRQDFQSRCHA